MWTSASDIAHSVFVVHDDVARPFVIHNNRDVSLTNSYELNSSGDFRPGDILVSSVCVCVRVCVSVCVCVRVCVGV